MGELKNKAREKQPGLIVVDRAVEGPNQNYLTPENRVPDKMLPYPWESCIIMGGGWSYSFDAKFKSERELIHMLVDIVSKGGNLLLNIGPSPEGTWYDEAYERLEGIGEWMEINSEAIYETRKIAPYRDGQVCFTQNKVGKAIYATYLFEEDQTLPKNLTLNLPEIPAKAKMTVLGSGAKVKYTKVGDKYKLEFPKKVISKPPSDKAIVIKIEN
jgi:alpha-L-fucosidase